MATSRAKGKARPPSGAKEMIGTTARWCLAGPFVKRGRGEPGEQDDDSNEDDETGMGIRRTRRLAVNYFYFPGPAMACTKAPNGKWGAQDGATVWAPLVPGNGDNCALSLVRSPCPTGLLLPPMVDPAQGSPPAAVRDTGQKSGQSEKPHDRPERGSARRHRNETCMPPGLEECVGVPLGPPAPLSVFAASCELQGSEGKRAENGRKEKEKGQEREAEDEASEQQAVDRQGSRRAYGPAERRVQLR